ncbi:UNVERIFIED_CONTAM: CDP-glycerol glycerophosphotransferase family protein [Actinomycetes bacterium ARC8]|nr:CDP-glycerol glycerophosphotransferase family protein [Actinomycetes bacterium ARC8]
MIAAHNVDKYIQATFASIDRQTVDLGDVEFIIVDDGSVDQTRQIAQNWATGKPNVIVYSQENQGVAGARQTGLDHAHGIWFTSIDPDDIIDKDYFKAILNFLSTEVSREINFAVTNIIAMNDSTGRLANNHALRHRFDRGNRVVALNNEPQSIQLGATALMLVDSVRKNSIEYKKSVKPTFEDAHFIGRYLSHYREPLVGIIADAKYYYRKRQNKSSLVQSSWSHIDKYSTVLEEGYLDLFLSAKKISGRVPQWIQFMVLYDLFWYFLEDSKQFARTAWLTTEENYRFLKLVGEIFEHIDIETIIDFNIYEVPTAIRQSVLVRFKNVNNILIDSDEAASSVPYEVIYCSPFSSNLFAQEKQINSIVHSFFGVPFCLELWIISDSRAEISNFSRIMSPGGSPNQFLHVSLPNYASISHYPKKQSVNNINALKSCIRKISRAFEIINIRALATGSSLLTVYKGITVSLFNRLLKVAQAKMDRRRRISIIKKSSHHSNKTAFKGAWCLMDRSSNADDNAEHLYRYLMKNRPDINAFFILERSSSDWNRLEKEGFKLLEPNSEKLSIVVLNSRCLISSDAVAECMFPVHRSFVNRSRVPFIFLQHGVLMNDLSRWLNPKKIDLIMTTTPGEYSSMVGPSSPYRIAPTQVSLTGLSRFDELIRIRNRTPEKDRNMFLIMPTWRHSLTSKLNAAESEAQRKELFEGSQYFREWHGLLTSQVLTAALERGQFQAVYVPHPSLRPFMDLIEFPDNIKIAEHGSLSMQEYIARSALLVTDYSSISFDAAYLDVPTVYFQFDRAEIFGGTHNFRAGYFSYVKNGFGPVTAQREEAIAEIIAEIENPSIRANYSDRFEAAFPQPDSQNSERIVKSIESFLSE